MRASLEVDLAGLRLRNPTILASGILGSSLSLLKRVEEAGAGAAATKTITADPREGYPNPVFVDLGFGYLNAMGLPNPGVEEFSRIIAEARRLLKIPVIASVGGGSGEEFLLVAERVLEAGCDAIELNLSCPHVSGYGLEVGSDPELASRIAGSVKSISSKPVFAKISIHQSELGVVEKVIGSGVDGITAINTIRAMAIDVDSMKPILSNIYGGLSGRCIRPIALAVVYRIHGEFPDIPIIGVGGVEDWKSALEFILAGASAVGIGSEIARKDLKIFSETVQGLEEFLAERGFRSITELRGYAHRI